VHDDQLGIHRPQEFISQAPIGVSAALGRFNPDISPDDKLEEDFFSLWAGNVERQAQLVTVAPFSANKLVANGAATTVPVLNTLMPASCPKFGTSEVFAIFHPIQ
jgi:hypothetical protein